jgi:hypothetical protein
MMSDEDKAKLRFELANVNLQSIGRAQSVYVTALLTYVCLVWSLVFIGPGGQAAIHLGLLDLNADGVWKITPFIILVLTLAYIWTVTAAIPAVVALRTAEKELFGSQDHSFFALDTHKNVVDYFAILQLFPWGRTRTPTDDGVSKPWSDRLHHLILPLIFIGSAITSYVSVRRLSALESAHCYAVIFGWSCFGLQVTFSMRPTWRFLWRMSGVDRSHDVYN